MQSPSALQATFCRAVRWSPIAIAHNAAHKHQASHGVGLRLLAIIRPKAATKASPLNKLIGLASFIGGSAPESVD